MPPRRDHDYESKRQQIIDGALRVFASKGYEKATNRDIAHASGIRSPGLIYHYFRDKRDLLAQTLQQRMPLLQLAGEPETLFAMSPREALTRIGRAFMSALDSRDSLALIRVLFGEAARDPEFAELYSQVGPNRGFAFLGDYLQRQMEAGAIRTMKPAAAARCFLGPLIVYALTREIFRQPDALALDRETMLLTAVDIFLEGALIG